MYKGFDLACRYPVLALLSSFGPIGRLCEAMDRYWAGLWEALASLRGDWTGLRGYNWSFQSCSCRLTDTRALGGSSMPLLGPDLPIGSCGRQEGYRPMEGF